MEPVPNRAKDPNRQALVHFYEGAQDEVGNTPYSHSAYVRRNVRAGSFHKGDIAKNTEGFQTPYEYTADREIPEDQINFVKPTKKDK
jgi:hypothetical protein